MCSLVGTKGYDIREVLRSLPKLQVCSFKVGECRVFENVKRPSWLTLDAPMFAKFIEFIYPEQDFDVIDEGWR